MVWQVEEKEKERKFNVTHEVLVESSSKLSRNTDNITKKGLRKFVQFVLFFSYKNFDCHQSLLSSINIIAVVVVVVIVVKIIKYLLES